MSNGVRFISAIPVSVIVFIILFGLLILVVPLFFLGIIGAAFIRLGFSWISAVTVVLLMVFGSFVNIPVYRIRRDTIRISQNDSPFQDARLTRPSGNVWDTSVSCNLGGAIIPAGISAYLFYNALLITGSSLVIPICAGIMITAAITFVTTRAVPGVGIHVPLLIPGLTALLVGLILSGDAGLTGAVTAFVSGTIGTLSGGNIANLFRVKSLDIPEFSIGGAGTFGAVFICCILPALIA
jgi:uncharacterized membrane protein